MAHAARCRRLASKAWRRTSRLRVRPAGRGAITGAFGNALSASLLMVFRNAQAIISEKSIVLFLSFIAHLRAPFCPGIFRAGARGWSDSSVNPFRRVSANDAMRLRARCQQLWRSLVFLGLSDLPSLWKA
jgi:hypothetical protein